MPVDHGNPELENLRRRQATLTLTRTFTPAEQQRRERIIAAARELAAERGYDATTVREIATLAGTTPATVYRYVGSKDRLLHHCMVEWALRTADDLRTERYTGSAAERVGAAFRDVVHWAARDRLLLAAGISSFRSTDTASDGLATWHTLFVAFVRAALDDDTWADTHSQALTLGHVLVACLLDLTSGRSDPDRIGAHIHTAAHLIFR